MSKPNTKQVDDLYKNIVPIADELVKRSSKEIDAIMSKIKPNIETMTTKDIVSYMLQLQTEAFYFSSRRDHAFLKQACADVLLKEGFAYEYTTLDGTQAARQQQATINTNEQQVVKLLYDAASRLMNTKLDEAHRMINVLNSALIAKNAEAKLSRGGEGENV